MPHSSEDFHPLAYEKPESSDVPRQARAFFDALKSRRTVREFSDQPVDRQTIEWIIRAAATAPSGAHQQPWTFCAISNPALKAVIRQAAEREEFENYHGRMSEEWLQELEKFATDWHKPFLTTAPWLIVVFKQTYGHTAEGARKKHYYVNESVGIACGMLIAAIHRAGLVTVTHTPSPMNFLQKILQRPANERPFLLLPVGYPTDTARVPKISRKSLAEVSAWWE